MLALELRGIQWLSETDFADLVHDLATHQFDWDPGRFGGRWSLAGAQPKAALFRDPISGQFGIPRDSTPTTVIVKPAITGYAQHHINEALCQSAASEAGLLAAASEVVEIADTQVLISTRYDRLHDGTRWHRIHQEDMCQALAVHPSLKYQSDGGPGVGEIADLLNRLQIEDRAVNAERFFKAVAYNVLIGGTDAHAKNYSLVLIGSRAQVSPLYDVASAAPYDQRERLNSSMKIGDHWKLLDVTNSDWRKVGRRLGIAGDQAVAWVDELRYEIPGAFERATTSLPKGAQPEAKRMAERIVGHVAGTWKPSLGRSAPRDEGHGFFRLPGAMLCGSRKSGGKAGRRRAGFPMPASVRQTRDNKTCRCLVRRSPVVLNQEKIMIRSLTLTVAAVTAAATLVFAPSARATPGCESVPWGFLGSQVRTLCDGPMLADGSWTRARVIWVRAHQVPFTCSYSTYSSSCSGGYFVDESVVSADKYPVRPDTVLPDQPGYLGPAGAPVQNMGTGLY